MKCCLLFLTQNKFKIWRINPEGRGGGRLANNKLFHKFCSSRLLSFQFIYLKPKTLRKSELNRYNQEPKWREDKESTFSFRCWTKSPGSSQKNPYILVKTEKPNTHRAHGMIQTKVLEVGRRWHANLSTLVQTTGLAMAKALLSDIPLQRRSFRRSNSSHFQSHQSMYSPSSLLSLESQ